MSRDIRHGPEIIWIWSEPGDMTRYDYAMYRDGPDEFCIMPTGSTFIFPQRMNRYQAKVIAGEGDIDLVMDFTRRYQCNPHTTLEVARAICQITGENTKTLSYEEFVEMMTKDRNE